MTLVKRFVNYKGGWRFCLLEPNEIDIYVVA